MDKPDSELRMARDNEVICHAQHHEGFVCTRQDAHRGGHAAHDDQGVVVKKWRGGRARWASTAVPNPIPSTA